MDRRQFLIATARAGAVVGLASVVEACASSVPRPAATTRPQAAISVGRATPLGPPVVAPAVVAPPPVRTSSPARTACRATRAGIRVGAGRAGGRGLPVRDVGARAMRSTSTWPAPSTSTSTGTASAGTTGSAAGSSGPTPRPGCAGRPARDRSHDGPDRSDRRSHPLDPRGPVVAERRLRGRPAPDRRQSAGRCAVHGASRAVGAAGRRPVRPGRDDVAGLQPVGWRRPVWRTRGHRRDRRARPSASGAPSRCRSTGRSSSAAGSG